MANTHKTATSQFTVPTMVELDPDYARAVEILRGLEHTHSLFLREDARIAEEYRNAPQSTIRPSVSVLLGDEVSANSRTSLAHRLGVIRQKEIPDHETAIQVQRQRVDLAKSKASAAVRDAVKAEYGKRVAALVIALEAAAEERNSLEQLTDTLSNDDVSWTQLGVFTPTFLGDRRDGHIQRLTREAKEAGYVD